jgi:hypothetical protein
MEILFLPDGRIASYIPPELGDGLFIAWRTVDGNLLIDEAYRVVSGM